MLWAERLLADRQRALEQRPRRRIGSERNVIVSRFGKNIRAKPKIRPTKSVRDSGCKFVTIRRSDTLPSPHNPN
jgi:hypothetical protein